MTQIVGYIRVSTEDQRLGPEAQESAIREHARREGLVIRAIERDQGIGGATPVDRRPGLLAALGALEHGDLLVAARRDRIGRDLSVMIAVSSIVRKSGAQVRTLDAPFLDSSTPDGALLLTILDAFSAYERALIASRTKAALAAKRARGETINYNGGRPPIGYVRTSSGLAPCPTTHWVVRRILSDRAAGRTVASIAHALTEERALGRSWSHAAVTRILAHDHELTALDVAAE